MIVLVALAQTAQVVIIPILLIHMDIHLLHTIHALHLNIHHVVVREDRDRDHHHHEVDMQLHMIMDVHHMIMDIHHLMIHMHIHHLIQLMIHMVISHMANQVTDMELRQAHIQVRTCQEALQIVADRHIDEAARDHLNVMNVMNVGMVMVDVNAQLMIRQQQPQYQQRAQQRHLLTATRIQAQRSDVNTYKLCYKLILIALLIDMQESGDD